MPTRIFILGPDGAELNVDTDQRGTEQTCSVCGKVIYRQEADGTLTTDEARFAGQLVVGGYIPATANAGYVGQRRIDFGMCLDDGKAIIGKLDPEMIADLPEPDDDARCLACKVRDTHHHKPCAGLVDDGTERPCKCFCQASKPGGDEHQDQAPVRIVAILGPDGRDSHYTAHMLADGTVTRYTDPNGADVDEATMRAAIKAEDEPGEAPAPADERRQQFEHVTAGADRP